MLPILLYCLGHSMNILVLYNATQTYTNAVYEHVASFGRFSRFRVFYTHVDYQQTAAIDLNVFDAVVIHYSIRLCFDQLPPNISDQVASFNGIKAIFVQDEYDHTYRTWHWIRELAISLVFTVVPEAGIAVVYPPEKFTGVRFVSNLTGYVPEITARAADGPPPSERKVVLGYRGRPLPLRYGTLGFEKIEVGRIVKAHCIRSGIKTDIAWDEESRIYGDAWAGFVQSCRAMLGSESGSNVFNWDGALENEIAAWRSSHLGASDAEVYAAVIAPKEIPGLMNQVSPRVFEAIASRTVLVLFEGNYSGIVEPDRHYIPLKRDGSNLEEVIFKLEDAKLVDSMANNAYNDIIASGAYSYTTFVEMVDRELEAVLAERESFPSGEVLQPKNREEAKPFEFTTMPIRAVVTKDMSSLMNFGRSMLYRLLLPVYKRMPEFVRNRIKLKFMRLC